MKKLLTLVVILITSVAANAQCLSDQIIGKRWVCVGKETNGEAPHFNTPYFYLTLENDNRFTKSSIQDGKVVYELTGTYSLDNCHLILNSNPRSVTEGVVRRVEEYDVNFSNDRYMTLSVSINGVLTRTYYMVYMSRPDMNRFNGRKN